MKRKSIILAVVLIAVLAFMAACGGSEDPADTETASSNAEENTGTESQSGVDWEVGEGTAVTWTDSIGSEWVQLVVPVTNTGSENLYLGSGTFDLEDESGALVKTLDMVSAYPEVLKPGETACYYEETGIDGDAEKNLIVVPHVDVEEATVDCIRLDVSETSIVNEEYTGGVRVKGRVENTTDADQELVYVSAILYDADNKVIGSVFTILNNTLPVGERIGFEAGSLSAPDSLNTDAVDHYEVFAYPSQMQF